MKLEDMSLQLLVGVVNMANKHLMMCSVGALLISLSCLLHQVSFIHTQVIPSMYKISINPLSLDGSSGSGSCYFVNTSKGQICNTPYTSVLFDGVIPSLTGINNSMCWASQLLTLSGATTITFNFTQPTNANGTEISFTAIATIEIVMFNCPSRRVGADAILILNGTTNKIDVLTQITIKQHTSCNSLVRICVDMPTSLNAIGLGFLDPLYYIYLAEVIFYSNTNSDCINGPVTTSTSSTTPTCSSITTPTDIKEDTPIQPTSSLSNIPASLEITTRDLSQKNNSNVTGIVAAVIVSFIVICTILVVVLLYLIFLKKKKYFPKPGTTDVITYEYRFSDVDVERQQSFENIKQLPDTPMAGGGTHINATVNKDKKKIKNEESMVNSDDSTMHANVDNNDEAETKDISEMYAVVDKSAKKKKVIQRDEDISEMYSVVDKSAKKKYKQTDEDISEMYSIVDKGEKKNDKQAD